MNLLRILATVTGITLLVAALACSTAAPAPAEPTPNIDATVEARVAQLIATYTEEILTALLPPGGGQVDPLVQLRDKELDIKIADMERKATEFSERHSFEERREGERQDITREKIDSQEDIALLRADINLERIEKMGSGGRGN